MYVSIYTSIYIFIYLSYLSYLSILSIYLYIDSFFTLRHECCECRQQSFRALPLLHKGVGYIGKSEILGSPTNVDYRVAKTLKSRMKWSLPLCERYAFLAKKFIPMEMRDKKDGWEECGD